MKVAETLLAVCVLALAGFTGVQVVDVQRRGTHKEAYAEAAGAIESAPAAHRARRGARRTATPTVAPTVEPTSGTIAAELTPDVGASTVGLPTNPTPVFGDRGAARDTRRRIAQGAPGTYIEELLTARDSALARWPDRLRRPLRVWIEETMTSDGWSSDFPPAVRDAFLTWGDAGLPLRFDFVRDSANADIVVRFTDVLPNGISGKTIWSRDADWWLVSSSIQLALVHPSGGFVTAPQMRAIALHEVGHLLGLDHSASSENIMAPRVRVRELSPQDKATIRLLYSVPAGSLK